MAKQAKTIQFFLPDGEPRGIRIADITTRIIQAVLVPRSKLADADSRAEIKNVGVYFLFGESEDAAKPVIYIGEAENCYQRIKQHNQTKDFWQTAIAIVSKTDSFTKTHVKYLEWHCVRQAKRVGRYALENGNEPSQPSVPEPMEADLMDAFETLNILTSSLGYPVFDAVKKAAEKDIFYCKGKGVKARGELVEDGFLVFAGSTATTTMSKSSHDYIRTRRIKLLESGVLVEDSDTYRFTSDYMFKTPSGAGGVILGRNSNGWTCWKRKDGKTLDELKRKNVD